MASRIQSFDEYYDLVDNFLDSDDFTMSIDDEDRDVFLTTLIVLVEMFYESHKYTSMSEVLDGSFDTELEELRDTLKEKAEGLVEDYITSVKLDKDVEYELPSDVMEFDDRVCNVIYSSIDAIINQLRDDATTKAQYYSFFMMLPSTMPVTFNLNSNFRLLVKRFKDGIDFNLQAIRKDIERKYLSFVYGDESLFYWLPSGRNTCAWCYMIAEMGAMPLSAFPPDHPNGACRLVPVNPEDYSPEYLKVRGRF